MLSLHHFNFSGPSTITPFSNQTQNVVDVAAVGQTGNRTNRSANSPAVPGLSMTLGVLSNIIALFILAKAYARLRRHSKATFLLFASSLVATDLAGHIIPGAVVLHLYSNSVWTSSPTHSDATCQFLGGSMVFFGLCPLFLGSAMAAERCLGVTQPLLHSRLVSGTRTKIALVLIWLAALSVALLPAVRLGEYTYQHPGTWCFIRVLGKTKDTDLAFLLLFSALGLGSLAMSFVCNTISGITLVRARLRRRKCHRRTANSHDIEMVAQLLGIMITSCICWFPLLIFGLMSVTNGQSDDNEEKMYYNNLMVTGVRLASCNQILDPWVYILLRRAVLRKIYQLTTGQNDMRGSTFRRWEISSLQSQSSEKKNTIKQI
ncbi:prostaglandin E receptor 1b (subtype EP1) [Tachysurus fulvidraco]|uniref:prostaglandin E receptor 1b (subtype EP1) n=1 Tax=Tachysurus fulvidraco TaxID=1234273 RepID=UPI001FF01F81|nr:prostaglandin E receptor 1b (subtype EP1) [Tachysurus fulvidraco]